NLGVHRAETDEARPVQAASEPVDFVELAGRIGDAQADRLVHTSIVHGCRQACDRAVAPSLEVLHRPGKRAARDTVRPHVGVTVDDHSLLTSPPSATRIEPLMKSARGDARYETSDPNSAGLPIRPAGIL